jgi:hypothetical protein
MDRFTEESYYTACAAAPANECQNCGNSVETLHRVPEFDYMGCDDCMEEALAVIARDACEHENVHTETHEDVNDEYVTIFEEITCANCGAQLQEAA